MSADWIAVPKIGSIVKAAYPATVANPAEWFIVHEVRVEREKAFARGAETIWFSVDMLTPAPGDWHPPAEWNE